MGIGRVLVFCAAVLLTACHGDSGDAPVDNSPTVHKHFVKRGPSPDDLTVGMVEAATTGKSTVPVDLKFELGGRPVAGQPLEVTLAVMPQIVADLAVVTVTGSDSLLLAPAVGAIEIPSVDPAQVYRHSIQLTPTAEGVQLLGIAVSLKHDDITETRTFSVPLIVAESAALGTAPAPTPGK